MASTSECVIGSYFTVYHLKPFAKSLNKLISFPVPLTSHMITAGSVEEPGLEKHRGSLDSGLLLRNFSQLQLLQGQITVADFIGHFPVKRSKLLCGPNLIFMSLPCQ